MKKITFLFIAFLTFGCATKKNIAKNKFVGIWQYPETSVWVKINSDNSVYQCRIARNNKVISSKGKLKGNIIFWEEVWKQDTINRMKNIISLNGKYGKFNYVKSSKKMNYKCNNPF